MAVKEIQCPNCQSYIKTQSEWLGMTLQCPSCGKNFIYTPNLGVSNPFAGGTPAAQMNLNARQGYGKYDPLPPGWTTALDKYADFSGRSSRGEYWLFMLHIAGFTYFINIFTGVLAIFMPVVAAIIYIIACCYYLYLLIPCISVTVRRLHDVNLSGWCILVGLIPFAGGLFLLIISCLPSNKNVNKWGREPNGRNPDIWWPCVLGIFVYYILPWLIYIGILAAIVVCGDSGY